MTDRIASIEWPTTYISIVPRASGILSVISSSIIIFVIFRSASKLSTIYHRIMFAMSTFDIMGSIGMALTSLPMPKEMPQERELGISWPGVRHGNAVTCNIQAFSITLGCATMTVYNVSLCIYYACAIHFRLSEENIRKYVQPIIFTVPILCGLCAAIPPLFLDLFNPPTSMASAWCMPIPYPDYISNESVTLRGKKNDQAEYLDWIAYFMMLFFVVVLVSLGLVMGTICFRPNETILITDSTISLPKSIVSVSAGLNLDNESNVDLSVTSRPFSLERTHLKGKKLRDGSQHATCTNEDVFREVGQSFQVNDNGVTKRTKSSMSNLTIPPKSKSDELLQVQINSGSVKSENASSGVNVKGKVPRDGYQSATKECGCHERRRSLKFSIGVNNSKSSIASFPIPPKSDNVEEVLHIPSKLIGDKSEIVSFALIGDERKDDSSRDNVSIADTTIEEQKMIEKMKMNPSVLALQALAYIVAFGFSTLLSFTFDPFDNGTSARFMLYITIFPLQGFMNMLIFFSHKVYNYRRVHRETSVSQVLRLFFTTRVQEPTFVERMAVVHDYQAERILVNTAFRLSNEKGDRLLILRRSHSYRMPSQDEEEASEESSDVVSSTYNRNRDDSDDAENGIFKTHPGYYSRELRFQVNRDNLADSVSSGSSDLDLSGFSSALSSADGQLK